MGYLPLPSNPLRGLRPGERVVDAGSGSGTDSLIAARLVEALPIMDIVLSRPVSEASKQDVRLWTGLHAGGLLEDELRALTVGAGFVDVEVNPGDHVFAGAPQHSNVATYGTRAAGVRARR